MGAVLGARVSPVRRRPRAATPTPRPAGTTRHQPDHPRLRQEEGRRRPVHPDNRLIDALMAWAFASMLHPPVPARSRRAARLGWTNDALRRLPNCLVGILPAASSPAPSMTRTRPGATAENSRRQLTNLDLGCPSRGLRRPRDRLRRHLTEPVRLSVHSACAGHRSAAVTRRSGSCERPRAPGR